MLNPWIALTLKAMQVGFDAQNVIFLRMMRLSAGGARGQSEAGRMVSEKIAASVEDRVRVRFVFAAQEVVKGTQTQ
jgi:hypothetical protein